MSDLDLTEAIGAHVPASVGSLMSEAYTGQYIVCTCSANRYGDGVRIPIALYPAHLLAAAAPLIEQQVRAKVAAEIEADRADLKERRSDYLTDTYVRGMLYGESVAANIARGDS